MQNTMNKRSTGMSDKDARAAGFKSAAEMEAFYANRARMRQRGGSAPGTKGKSAPYDSNQDKSLLGRIFKPVNDALSGKK